jgi:hypothetical protein
MTKKSPLFNIPSCPLEGNEPERSTLEVGPRRPLPV